MSGTMRFGDNMLVANDDSQSIEGFIFGSLYGMGSPGGLGQSITVKLTIATSAMNCKCALYNADLSLVQNSITEALSIPVITRGIYTFKFGVRKPVLRANTWYWICSWGQAGAGTIRMHYNISGGAGISYQTLAYGTWPDPWNAIDWSVNGTWYSIYCTWVPNIPHADNGIGLKRHPRSRIY